MFEDSSDESTSTQVVLIRKDKEPNWKKCYLNVNVWLFKSYSGKPLYFYVNTFDHTLKKKYEELISSFGGFSVKYKSDVNDKTACLVENNSRLYGLKPCFKLSYVIDCVMGDTLLNINDYMHSNHLGSNRDFMKIFFWEKGAFRKEVERFCGSSDECESISEFSVDSKVTINFSKLGKNTREPYTRDEKEAMLKFILTKKKLDGLRGNSIWKLMERKGVCPRRTYQSMKNHFLKTIIFELDKFEFLSEIEKSKLKKTL